MNSDPRIGGVCADGGPAGAWDEDATQADHEFARDCCASCPVMRACRSAVLDERANGQPVHGMYAGYLWDAWCGPLTVEQWHTLRDTGRDPRTREKPLDFAEKFPRGWTETRVCDVPDCDVTYTVRPQTWNKRVCCTAHRRKLAKLRAHTVQRLCVA